MTDIIPHNQQLVELAVEALRRTKGKSKCIGVRLDHPIKLTLIEIARRADAPVSTVAAAIITQFVLGELVGKETNG